MEHVIVMRNYILILTAAAANEAMLEIWEWT